MGRRKRRLARTEWHRSGFGHHGHRGGVALAANTACLALPYAWCDGDANMRSVWVCSRNDVIANLKVLAAALGVFGTRTGWPDIIVASVMTALALQGAAMVARHALAELGTGPLAGIGESGAPLLQH